MSIIAVPKSIQEKFGSECTRDLLEMFKELEASTKDRTLEVVEDRFERRLTEEIYSLKVELHKEIADTRQELLKEIVAVRIDSSKNKAEIIKWMFIFYLGQIAVILGVLFTFFRR